MTGAGQLRHRITIEAPVTTDSPSGQRRTTSWATVATVWAAVRTIRADESRAAATPQVEATWTHEITIRTGPAVDARCRIKLRGRSLSIVSVIDVDALGRELLIQAIERGA